MQVDEPLHESPVQRPPPPPPPPLSTGADGTLGSHPVAADEDEVVAVEEVQRQMSAGPASAPQPIAPAAVAV